MNNNTQVIDAIETVVKYLDTQKARAEEMGATDAVDAIKGVQGALSLFGLDLIMVEMKNGLGI